MIAGLFDMIPNLGATIAGVILVPVILAEEGLTAALIMLAVVLIYQQVENNVVTPKVQGKAVHLSGLLHPSFSVTLFGALLGVLGALTAVPLAATIQILIQELTKARREQVAAAKAGAPSRLPHFRPLRPDRLVTAERHICLLYAVGLRWCRGVRPEEPVSPTAADHQHERPRALRPGREASRPFELLRAKLHVPLPRPGLVERTGLIGRLSRERSGRVVSVVAPPGYGKTTVLGQWAAHDRREFVWVSLDPRDNDPVVLLTYVAEALNADSTVDPAVFKALRGSGDSLWARGLPRLGAALAARPDPLVLVLDDVHELRQTTASTPLPRCCSTCREGRNLSCPGVLKPGSVSRSSVPTASCSSWGLPHLP